MYKFTLIELSDLNHGYLESQDLLEREIFNFAGMIECPGGVTLKPPPAPLFELT